MLLVTPRLTVGAFEGFHDTASWLLLQKYCVGELDPLECVKPTEFEKDVQEIRQKVKKMGLYQVSMAYYTTITSIIFGFIAFSFAIIKVFPNSVLAILLSSGCLGIAFQQSGWFANFLISGSRTTFVTTKSLRIERWEPPLATLPAMSSKDSLLDGGNKSIALITLLLTSTRTIQVLVRPNSRYRHYAISGMV